MEPKDKQDKQADAAKDQDDKGLALGKPPDEPPPGKQGTWQEALDKASESRKKWKEQAKAAEQELEKYRQAEKDKLRQDEAAHKKAEMDRLEKEGKYKEAISLVERQSAEKHEAIRRRVSEKLVPLAIRSAASEVKNLSPDAINDLPEMLSRHLAVDDDTLELYVRGEDGKPLVDDKLRTVKPEKFIRQFIEARPYLLVDGMPKSHGQSGGGQPGRQWDIAAAVNDPKMQKEWEASDPEGFKAAWTAYWDPKAILARVVKK